MVVLHIPHASTVFPDDERARLTLNDAELDAELLVMTDWFTDELFALSDAHVETVRFPVSRLVLDPERFLDDQSERMAERGMGVVYERTSHGQVLRSALSSTERQLLIDTYYSPHHERLERAVAAELAQSDAALVIDCHSFSSEPLPHEFDQDPLRPDVCIGTDDFHTPTVLVQVIEEFARAHGWSTQVDRPFAGALVPMSYYRMDARVHAVMIEVNRSLYMNEKTGRRLAAFAAVASHLQDLVRLLINRDHGRT